MTKNWISHVVSHGVPFCEIKAKPFLPIQRTKIAKTFFLKGNEFCFLEGHEVGIRLGIPVNKITAHKLTRNLGRKQRHTTTASNNSTPEG
jgi:hypothetical protein